MSLRKTLSSSGPVIVLLVAAVTVVVLHATDGLLAGKSSAENMRTEYCEMVNLNIDSMGQLGWPDYKGTFMRDCIK